jgi:hypothetical protein
VGEERKGRPLEEGEEGEAFIVPSGGFATLRFEGLFVVVKGEREGAQGVRTEVRGVLLRRARLHRDG